MQSKIIVEIIYALPENYFFQKVILKKDSSVIEAIYASEILTLFKNIDFKKNKIGIFSKIVNLKDKLNNGDRIEIYRSLIISPREWRLKKIQIETK